MNRRDVLLGGAMIAGAATLPPAAPADALVPVTRRSRVETRDGIRLRVRDWGVRRPVVFLSGWGLPSDFWHYQFLDLAPAGRRCRRSTGRRSPPTSGPSCPD